MPLPGLDFLLLTFLAVNCVIIALANWLPSWKYHQEMRGEHSAVILLGFLVPMVIFCIFTEIGRADRYIFLWPFQCILLAIFFQNTIELFKIKKVFLRVACYLLVIVAVCNPLVATRLHSWATTGWSGERNEKREVVEYIAEKMISKGVNKASIGYHIYFRHYTPAYHIKDDRYKVGANMDLMFRFIYGIENLTTCAEGFSKEDQYRIVMDTPTKQHRSTFNVGVDPVFTLIAQFGSYKIYERTMEKIL